RPRPRAKRLRGTRCRRSQNRPGLSRPAIECLEGRVLLCAGDAVKWSFGDTVTNDYTLSAVSSPDANLGTVGAHDPTLHLDIGTRYTVTIADRFDHPLQIIAKGATAFDDRVLLTQS